MAEEITPAQHVVSLLNKDIFGTGSSCQGCGEQLGLKIALQVLGRCVLVNSNGTMSLLAKYPKTSFSVPYVNCGLNAAATASGIARALQRAEKKPDFDKVVVYSGDGATLLHLSDVIAAAGRNDNVIYICYNNLGFGSAGHFSKAERSLTKSVALHCSYAATASISHPDDFAAKLRKSAALPGFKFIEVLTPCPASWHFDSSITVEVARLAVETGLWPLYEVEHKRVNLTRRPLRLEPVDRYTALLKRTVFAEEEIAAMQESARRNYRLLGEGKLA